MNDTANIIELERLWQRVQLFEVGTSKAKTVFGLPLQSVILIDRKRPYKYVILVGGFGNTLEAQKANERNTCIGDIIRIGRDIIAQNSLPRQLCYNPNHHFQENNMPQLTEEPFRTGWHCRYIQEGSVQAGDEIVLVERMQHHLYTELENMDMMKQLTDLDSLGKEVRTNFLESTGKDKEGDTPTVTPFVFEALDPGQSPQEVQPDIHVRAAESKRDIHTKELDRRSKKALQDTDSSAPIYWCFGERLMKALRDTKRSSGFPNKNLRSGSFQASTTGDPSIDELAESWQKADVRDGASLLDARFTGLFDNGKTLLCSSMSHGRWDIVLYL
ncbi:uncharacterized protein N7484_002575 [Penicillium longicatenatum]|uniref:uncharacterized protein n=1 Tax=Penicillium longicatenatum TaxID=1561947 RepID=UPI002546A61B|nr:uncharacterized protein N7484_002575 [Penicillium longicatenatum]KAJ5648852.1 hypothetical protein N7484_002575 [Penicillium longicatenatum]